MRRHQLVHCFSWHSRGSSACAGWHAPAGILHGSVPAPVSSSMLAHQLSHRARVVGSSACARWHSPAAVLQATAHTSARILHASVLQATAQAPAPCACTSSRIRLHAPARVLHAPARCASSHSRGSGAWSSSHSPGHSACTSILHAPTPARASSSMLQLVFSRIQLDAPASVLPHPARCSS